MTIDLKNIFTDGARYLYGYKAAPTTSVPPGLPSFRCPDTGFNTREREAAQLTDGVSSWAACSDLCRRRRGCRYWTWHHENAGQYSYRCVTMTQVNYRVADPSAVSGTKNCRDSSTSTPRPTTSGTPTGSIPAFLCPDISFNTRGRIDAELKEGVASWSACRDLCRERRECRYWTWHKEEAGQYAFRCITMTDVSLRIGDSNAVSGTKKCEGITFS